MIVDCAVYTNGQRRPGMVELEEALEAAREPDSFVWIGLYEPDDDEFDRVRKEFELHPLAVEDAIHAHQRPKVEPYGDTLFVVLKTARYDDVHERVEFAEIQLFIGDCFVVTVRHGEASALSDVRRSIEQRPDLLKCGPPAVLYAVVDRVVDDYEPVVSGLDNDISEIEAQVFSDDPDDDPTQRIYFLKREVQDFYRHTRPLVDALDLLAQCKLPHGKEELASYFRDVHDHLLRVVGAIEDFRVQLADALSANLTQVGIRQNEDMRKISALVAIGGIPTVIGAIYGMNFEHMPELGWRFGYPLAMAVILIGCYWLYRRFKASGWL